MAFLKKNWAQLILVALCIAGVILAIVLLARSGELNGTSFAMPFGALSLWVGYILLFCGVGLMLVLRMTKLSNGYAHALLVLTGLLVTVFMIVAMADVIGNWERAFAAHPQMTSDWSILAIAPVVIQLIVFGLFPLVIGARRLLNHYHVHKARKN
ncbi:MAG: hypothetical protein FWE31_01910 [Firmicutes bacterium]|nr:hypothetical protein [Bacillota bacterium]